MIDDFFITQSGFFIPNPQIRTSKQSIEGKPLEGIENNLLENFRQKQREAREALYELSVFYNKTGRKDRALPILEYLTKNTEDPGEKGFFYYTQGQYMEQIGDFEKAVVYYQQAFALEPSNQRIWYFIHNNLGFSLNKLGRYSEGERFCKAAIKINPMTHNAYKNLGIALEGQAFYLDAAKNYIQATKYNVVDERAFHHLEDLLERQPQLLNENPELVVDLGECREAVRIAQEIFRYPRKDLVAKYSLVRVRTKNQKEDDDMNDQQSQLDISR